MAISASEYFFKYIIVKLVILHDANDEVSCIC